MRGSVPLALILQFTTDADKFTVTVKHSGHQQIY